MGTALNPYIHFDGTAAEAMTFYQSVLGGQLDVSTFGEFGQEGPEADKIMHSRLAAADGMQLMASDTPPGMPVRGEGNIALSLSGDDSSRLHRQWEQLSDGGTVQVPLEKQMWGDEFGQCVDRFGVTWLVNISQQP